MDVLAYRTFSDFFIQTDDVDMTSSASLSPVNILYLFSLSDARVSVANNYRVGLLQAHIG
jgi:hypothetical protein